MKKQGKLFFLLLFIGFLSMGAVLFAVSLHVIFLNDTSIYSSFLKSNNSDFTYIQKRKSVTNDIQEFNDQDIQTLKEQMKIKISKCYSVYPKDQLGLSLKNLNLDVPDIRTLPYYYIPAANQFNYSEIVEIDSPNDLPYKEFVGTFPKKTGEVIISSLLADYIIKFSQNIKSYDEIISNKTSIDLTETKKLQITGIIKLPLDEFEVLKNEQPTDKSIVGEARYSPNKDENIPELYQQFLNKTNNFQNIFSISNTIKNLEKDCDFNIIISSVYLNYSTIEIADNFLNLNPVSSDGMIINSSDNILSQIETLKSLSKLGLKISFFVLVTISILELFILKKSLSTKTIFKILLITLALTITELYFSVKFVSKHFAYVSPNYSLNINVTFPQILLISLYILTVFDLILIKKFFYIFKQK